MREVDISSKWLAFEYQKEHNAGNYGACTHDIESQIGLRGHRAGVNVVEQERSQHCCSRAEERYCNVTGIINIVRAKISR